jgi:hypothetical protein
MSNSTVPSGSAHFGIRRAIAEFAVIVIGVLTALAVDGLASRRRESELEREYLDRLERDVSQNLQSLKTSEIFYKRVASRAVAALDIVEGRAPYIGPSEALAVLYNTSRGDAPAFFEATYQELISTGALRLIKDVSLRAELARYHLTARDYLYEFVAWDDRNPYRNRIRRLIPPDIQARIVSSCPIAMDNLKECDVAGDSTRVRPLLTRITTDEELRLDLVIWVAAQPNIERNTRGLIERTELMLKQIQEAK